MGDFQVGFLSRIFGQLIGPIPGSEEGALRILRQMTNGLGEYALGKGDKDKGIKMIRWLEALCEFHSESQNPHVQKLLGEALRDYAAWYACDSDREPVLRLAVQHLERAIHLAPANVEFREMCALLLIEEEPVRDLGRGIDLLEQIRADGQLDDKFEVILNEAKQMRGDAV